MQSWPSHVPGHRSNALAANPKAPAESTGLQSDRADGAPFRCRHDFHVSSCTPRFRSTTLLEARKRLLHQLRTGNCKPRTVILFSLVEVSALPEQKFRVGLVQMSATSDPDKNLERAIEQVHQAS